MLIQTNPELFGEFWMHRQLQKICGEFSEAQLQNLSRAHYQDAIKILENAEIMYDTERQNPN